MSKAISINVEGLSERNIRYCKTFYLLYSQVDVFASHIAKTSENDTIKENLTRELPKE